MTLGRAADAYLTGPVRSRANTRKVCGRILRRVAAGFGEDIVPGAASAWGQECRGRQGHRFGDSSSAARSFTIKAVN